MFALERQKRILQRLQENGAVWVSRLAQELDVTEETVRRDLEKLERQEALMRTHGGAVPVDATGYELSLEKRKHMNVGVKQQLALEAVKLILPGDTVFLDASTTTFYMAKALRGLKNVTVVTNSLRAVSELAGQDGLKVICVGGMVSNNQSVVGPVAEREIRENYFADKMFFSSKGVVASTGILEGSETECGIKQQMLANSRHRYYLCDKTKFDRVGFVKCADLSSIDAILTDAAPDDKWLSWAGENGVSILSIAKQENTKSDK